MVLIIALENGRRSFEEERDEDENDKFTNGFFFISEIYFEQVRSKG